MLVEGDDLLDGARQAPRQQPVQAGATASGGVFASAANPQVPVKIDALPPLPRRGQRIPTRK
jgi:hypothetical protein